MSPPQSKSKLYPLIACMLIRAMEKASHSTSCQTGRDSQGRPERRYDNLKYSTERISAVSGLVYPFLNGLYCCRIWASNLGFSAFSYNSKAGESEGRVIDWLRPLTSTTASSYLSNPTENPYAELLQEVFATEPTATLAAVSRGSTSQIYS